MCLQKKEVRMFTSMFGADSQITAAQYIAEILCNRSYQNGNLNINLPDKFWKEEEWARYFRGQITMINKLLKDYHIVALLKTLREERWIYSASVFNNSRKVKSKLLSYNKVALYNVEREKTITVVGDVDKLPNKKKGGEPTLFSKLGGVRNG